MSTGDQTAYLRSKMATRRDKLDYGGPGGQWSSPPIFAKDGFQRWAEGPTPTRKGGSLKTPAIEEMAKQRHGGGISEKEIRDFIGLLPAGKIGDPLRSALNKAVDFYVDNNVTKYGTAFKKLMKNTGVRELAEEAGGKVILPIMDKIHDYMDLLGFGHMKHDQDAVRRVGSSKPFKDWCAEEEAEHRGRGMSQEWLNGVEKKARSGGVSLKSIRSSVKNIIEGSGITKKHQTELKALMRGRINSMKGGDIAEMAKQAAKTAKEFAEKVKSAYNFVAARKKSIHAILESPDINEDLDTDIPRKIAKAMSLVGLGHGGDLNSDLARGFSDLGAQTGFGPQPASQAFGKVAARSKHPQEEEMMSDIKMLMNQGFSQKEAEKIVFKKYMGGRSGGDFNSDLARGFSDLGAQTGLGPQRMRDEPVVAMSRAGGPETEIMMLIKQGVPPKEAKARVKEKYGMGIGKYVAKQAAIHAIKGMGKVDDDAAAWWAEQQKGHQKFKEDAEEHFRKQRGMGQGASVYMEGGRIGMGGRKPSAYAQFVKQFASQHPGPDLMKRAAQAWRNR